MKQITPEGKAEELYTPHDNMFMAKRKAFVEGANWQSPTPEAVAVAYHFWADLNYTRVKTSVIPYGEYKARFGNDNRIYTASDLFTLFTASPEYKELFK